MAAIKMTKNELRSQQFRLSQFQKYLPTLQLKKAMLQSEVYHARMEVAQRSEEKQQLSAIVDGFTALLTEALTIDLAELTKVLAVGKHYENIAGVEVPVFEGIEFAPLTYTLLNTPPWVDGAIAKLRQLKKADVQLQIAEEKATALEAELRDVSIRVNLFEKVLIPGSLANIKKIRVFLGDQQLMAIGQAKMARAKIIQRKQAAVDAA